MNEKEFLEYMAKQSDSYWKFWTLSMYGLVKMAIETKKGG